MGRRWNWSQVQTTIAINYFEAETSQEISERWDWERCSQGMALVWSIKKHWETLKHIVGGSSMFFQRIQVFSTFLLTFPPHTADVGNAISTRRPCCQIRWRQRPRCSLMMTRNLSWPKCLRIKQCGPWQSQWPVCSQFSWRSLNGINGILCKAISEKLKDSTDSRHPTYSHISILSWKGLCCHVAWRPRTSSSAQLQW